jgi:hypothetical protein
MDTPTQADLRARIRWLLQTGALSTRTDQRLYGGRGAGETCACCARSICATQVLYEIESTAESLLAMHLQCFELWESESRARTTALAESRDQSLTR